MHQGKVKSVKRSELARGHVLAPMFCVGASWVPVSCPRVSVTIFAVQAECLPGVTWATQSALRLRGKRLRLGVSGSGSGLREAAVSGRSQAVRGTLLRSVTRAQDRDEINLAKSEIDNQV